VKKWLVTQPGTLELSGDRPGGKKGGLGGSRVGKPVGEGGGGLSMHERHATKPCGRRIRRATPLHGNGEGSMSEGKKKGNEKRK